ncbi:GntR family transcriptional regulator, partial [Thermomicrobium sp.]|uniref:GntR family transcriptional regulator n=1 Tax=Thermomicrobium sp. TaxID=1969469 RepID=UPI001B2275DD
RVLREEIKEYLIDAILRGQLRPGDRIIETRIAQDLGVSQTPVREALRDLELLGFVTSEPFRGTRVRAFTHEELVQIYPIRAAIEGVAARAAATRITTEQLLALEEQIDRMREASELGDEATAIEADIAFHRIIVEASGNRLLEQFWTSLVLATTTFLTFSIHRRAIEGLAARHEPILEALRARDPDRAEAAMRRHIEEPGRWVYEALSREDPEPQQSS